MSKLKAQKRHPSSPYKGITELHAALFTFSVFMVILHWIYLQLLTFTFFSPRVYFWACLLVCISGAAGCSAVPSLYFFLYIQLSTIFSYPNSEYTLVAILPRQHNALSCLFLSLALAITS